MVRTYAFNPSTQSTAIQQAMPFVDTRNNYSKSLQEVDFLNKTRKQSQDYLAEDFPSLPEFENYPTVSDQNGYNKSMKQNGHSAVGYQQFRRECSPPQMHQPATNDNKRALSIEEEKTTILEIHSVLINGQRFYQPIDVTPENSTVSSAATPKYKTEARKTEAMIPLLATAIRANVNGHQSPRQRNWERKQRSDSLEMRVAENPLQNVHSNNCYNSSENRNHQLYSPLYETKLLSRANPNESRNGSFHRSPPVEDRLQDECPWGRNPQPKSGVRGSRNWMGGGQTILPSIQKNGHTKLDGSTKSFSSIMSLPFSASINYNNTIDERWTEKAEKERNRIELLRQIEENKHRKFMEKQKQQEIERRERIRDEMYQQRIKLELEEEQRKEREKALLMEKKAARIEAVKKATIQAIKETQEIKRRGSRSEKKAGKAEMNVPEHSEDDKGDVREEKLEWWERKDRRRAEQLARQQRSPSPIIPALRRRSSNSIANSTEDEKENSVSRRLSNGSGSSSRSKSLGSGQRGEKSSPHQMHSITYKAA